MKLLILGGGLMGPAAAYQAMSDPQVSQVIICDTSQNQLEKSITMLTGKPGAEKLGVVRLDLQNQAAAVNLLSNFDVAVAALPWSLSTLAIETALKAKTPLVDLAIPKSEELLKLPGSADDPPIILGGGLEPGLTEIVAHHLADQLDTVEEVHIKCGGIPVTPKPPLGYKIVFGGKELPLREADAQMVVNGQLIPVPRYSGVEPVSFPGLGECEAWHEGFMPWLLNLPGMQNLRAGTQKTIRWPGYAAKISVLKEMGLLSETPVAVNGTQVAPKALLNSLLYPRVKLDDGEHDLTLFRVEVMGHSQNRPHKLQVDMIDRYDEATGFTSMARTTAFTGAILAQMLAAGQLPAGNGLQHPERLITGKNYDALLAKLAEHNINFKFSSGLT